MTHRPQKPEPVVIEIPGATMTVRPFNVASFEVCRAAAAHQVAALRDNPEILEALGFQPDEIERQDVIDALTEHFLIIELGVRHITAWTGIAGMDGATPAAVTPENVAKVLSDLTLSRLFYDRMRIVPALRHLAKKDSGTAAPGTSSPAPVPPTAPAAEA